jgi:hypothetical protein
LLRSVKRRGRPRGKQSGRRRGIRGRGICFSFIFSSLVLVSQRVIFQKFLKFSFPSLK